MPAVRKDLVIEQGATFVLDFVWHLEDPDEPGEPGSPVDLTGSTARMQVRKSQQSPILVDARSTGDSPRIILGGNTGRIIVTLTDEDTDLLTSKKALYDLEVKFPAGAPHNGRVVRLLKGAVDVDPNITQETEDPVVS